MNFVRVTVVAVVLLASLPAVAQESGPRRRPEPPIVRTLVIGYTGIHGRFIFGRPVFRPRVAVRVDDFIEEGRPLGFSPHAYGYSPFARSQVWTGWPYYEHGRDEAPKVPPKAVSEAALSEGRLRWRAGDFEGALACFKKAVAEDLENGSALLHMALALVATGDFRNADKALTSALEVVRQPEELTAVRLPELFRNAKERARFEEKLHASRDGTGALSVALAQHLLGQKERASRTLESVKDPAGAKLGALMR